MKITKNQLVRIIKEEAASFKKEIALKKELAQIERQLNEVAAGSLYDASETAGKKYDEKFEHPKNPVTGKESKTTFMEVEDEMGDSQEELMNALKTIAKACGLSGSIELEDEEEVEIGDEEDSDEEVEVDVDMEDEEGEDEEGEEEVGEEEGEGEEEVAEEDYTGMGEGMKEEGMKEEGMKEEGMKEEGVKEEGQEESTTMNESFEIKRMKQLAGII